MTDMSFTKRSNTHYSRGLDPEYMRIFGGKYAEELDGLYGPEGERCGRFPVTILHHQHNEFYIQLHMLLHAYNDL